MTRALAVASRCLTMFAYQEPPPPSAQSYAPKAGHIPGSSLADERQRSAQKKSDYGTRSHHPTIYKSKEERAAAEKARAFERNKARCDKLFKELEQATNQDAMRILGLNSDASARSCFLTLEQHGLVERVTGGVNRVVVWKKKADA